MSAVAPRVTVTVPASSANLGPGFDTLALALDLRLRAKVEAAPGEGTAVVLHGEGEGRIGTGAENRFLVALERGLRSLGAVDSGGWRIELHNPIPLGRGLGSSAAATVAGLVAAHELAGAELDEAAVLALAADIEGHPDNAAAALLGGFVVVAGGRIVRYDPPSSLRAVLYVPDRELATTEMRAVLPAVVARADAVHNVGRTAMIVSAFATGDLSLLAAMDDRLHEPYRASAFPELPALLSAAREAGALGAALSGAGSTVIALCEADDSAAGVEAALADTAHRLSLSGSTRVVRPTGGGVQAWGDDQ